MKRHTALVIIAASPVFAGTVETPVPAPEPSSEPWIKPTIDIRTRYEFGDIDGLDNANAWTFRERLGLKTASWNGFSGFVEGEFSQAAVDDYHGGAPGADPFDPANTVIADPETNEMNQAFLQYDGYETTVKAGRQRIIYDNAAFIGNVGWRQNEQTLDAASLAGTWFDGFTANYAYVSQVNRIFGSDADAPLVVSPNVQDIGASTHLINLAYKPCEEVKLGTYAYLMEFENKPNWDNNTFGVIGGYTAWNTTFYGEFAFQDEAGPISDQKALYAHGSATVSFWGQSLTAGIEHLDAGFKTPLGTVHAFNGYADAFIGGRIEGSHNGLTDTYVAHTLPIFFGMKWINSLHAYGDNQISSGYGWEFDSVLSKKFNDNFLAIAKFAYFNADNDPYVGAAALADTTRVSIELNYTF
jgi:hypothetical protein